MRLPGAARYCAIGSVWLALRLQTDHPGLLGPTGSHRLGPHQSQWNWRPCPCLLSPLCLLPKGLRGSSRASRVSASRTRVGLVGAASPQTLPSLGPSGLGQGTEARVMGGRAGGGLEEGSAGGPMTKILQRLPRDGRGTWVTLGNPATGEGEVFYAENWRKSQRLGTLGQVGERLATAIARRQEWARPRRRKEPGSVEGRSHAQRQRIPAIGKGT